MAKVFTTSSSHLVLVKSGEAGLELFHLWIDVKHCNAEFEQKMMMFGGMTLTTEMDIGMEIGKMVENIFPSLKTHTKVFITPTAS